MHITLNVALTMDKEMEQNPGKNHQAGKRVTGSTNLTVACSLELLFINYFPTVPQL